MILESNEIIMILLTSSLGSFTRIAYEWNEKDLTIRLAVLIIIASIVVGYMLFVFNQWKQIVPMEYIGLFLIIGGVSSIGLVKILIHDLPTWIKKFVGKKININVDNQDDETDNQNS